MLSLGYNLKIMLCLREECWAWRQYVHVFLILALCADGEARTTFCRYTHRQIQQEIHVLEDWMAVVQALLLCGVFGTGSSSS